MNKIKIERVRYIVQRVKDNKIFCGLARNYTWKSIDDIGNTAIKTYLSKNKALSSVISSYGGDETEYKAIEVIEAIGEV